MKPGLAHLLILVAIPLALIFSGCSPLAAPSEVPGNTSPPSAEISIAADEILQLGLDGSLILIRFVDGTPALFSLDLDSAELKPIFKPPRGAWITAASASSETNQIAIAYSPAPAQGQSQLGFTGISLLSLDGRGQPEEFIQAVDEQALFSFPEWAPDGSALYFNRFQFGSEASSVYTPVIGRQDYPEGISTDLVEFGQWPRIARDGRLMVYTAIATDPSGGSPELLEVYDLSSADVQPVTVSVGPEVELLDVPMFSPDGQMIYFSAPTSTSVEDGSTLSTIARFFGVRDVQAHDVPSDWWRVPLGGGLAERLTDVGDTGMYGEFSPDGTHMAFISSRGVFVMDPDGSNVVTLINGDGFFGTIDWVP